MAPAPSSSVNGTLLSSPFVGGSRLVSRSVSQKAVPNGTVNTIIAVTVIFGVLFIAFALTVIYWRYMAKIDREDRERHARIELCRVKKMATSKSSSKEGHVGTRSPRPRGGKGPSRGESSPVPTRNWNSQPLPQIPLEATTKLGHLIRTRKASQPTLRRRTLIMDKAISQDQANETLLTRIAGTHHILFITPIVLHPCLLLLRSP